MPSHAARRCSGSAGRSGASISVNLGAVARLGRRASASSASRSAARPAASWSSCRTRRSSSRCSSTVFPSVDYASAGGFLQLAVRRVRRHPRRPRRGDVRRRLGVGRDVGTARDGAGDAAQPRPLGARGRPRHVRRTSAIFVALTAAGIGIGVATTDSDVATPLVGSLVLGLYAAALAGVGHGGRWRVRHALRRHGRRRHRRRHLVRRSCSGRCSACPTSVRELALTSHFGQPMVGVWDAGGIVASLALAIGGVLSGPGGSPGGTCAADRLLRRHPAVDELVVVARRAVRGG